MIAIAAREQLNKTSEASPWPFFALALGLSWFFWVPAIFFGRAGAATLTTMLHLLGGIGPLATALLLLYWREDQAARWDYWRRIVDWRRIRARWYLVIFFTVPVLTFLPALLDRVLGGTGIALEAAARFITQPWAILPFALFLLFFGPAPEEMAWSGYGLDRLQVRHSALVAGLILGTIWSIWHLPLYFIEGTYQHGLGIGSHLFWFSMLVRIPLFVLMTWVYNNTRRSTLAAILFHFMGNFMGELFALSVRAELFSFIAWVLAAVLVTVIQDPETTIQLPPHLVPRK